MGSLAIADYLHTLTATPLAATPRGTPWKGRQPSRGAAVIILAKRVEVQVSTDAFGVRTFTCHHLVPSAAPLLGDVGSPNSRLLEPHIAQCE